MVVYGHSQIVAVLVVLLAMGAGIVSADTRLGAVSPEQDPPSEVQLTGDGAEPEYGRSVAINGNLVAVGAVYLYRRPGRECVPGTILDLPDGIPDTCPGDFETCPEFGRTVAIQGNTVFVGARFAAVGDMKAGTVYVFRKHGDLWQCEEKIASPAPEAGDNFGRALAVQGNLLIVTDRKSSLEEGAAYVFEDEDGGWAPRAVLTASDSAPEAYFGQSVAVQGEYMAIGARNSDPNAAGGFYLFRRSGDAWIEVARVTRRTGGSTISMGSPSRSAVTPSR